MVVWYDVTSTDSSVIGTLNAAVRFQLLPILALPLLRDLGEIGYVLVVSASVSALLVVAVEKMVSVMVKKVVLSVFDIEFELSVV